MFFTNNFQFWTLSFILLNLEGTGCSQVLVAFLNTQHHVQPFKRNSFIYYSYLTFVTGNICGAYVDFFSQV